MQRKSSNNKHNITQSAFFALLRAGLWEKEVQLLPYGEIDYSEVMRLAEEQSVVGLIAAGIEHVVDVKVPQIDFLTFEGLAYRFEQQNSAMNAFIGTLISKMQKAGIYTLLVKGQGIAQCYERPLWRSCGDIDLFLNDDNYDKAKAFLTPLASSVEKEYVREKHLGMTIDSWVVELHGSLYSGLSSSVEKELDEVYQDTFYRGNVRSWMNGNVSVFQLSVENDAFYVFTHFLQHFFKVGVGLRQICDWCRLLYTNKDSLNYERLEQRIRRAGLMSEWKAFGAFAVEYLGMPIEAMPFLDGRWKMEDGRSVLNARMKKKADRICDFILEVGNMGHNRDSSYFEKYPYVIRKAYSLGRRCGDLIRHARIFPLDSIRFLPRIMFNGVVSAIRGE